MIGIQINWDCDLNRIFHSCLPKYSFRRLDEKESNRTLYPGLNFRCEQLKSYWKVCEPLNSPFLKILSFVGLRDTLQWMVWNRERSLKCMALGLMWWCLGRWDHILLCHNFACSIYILRHIKNSLYSSQAGKFSIIQLIIYIGSTLSYYAIVSNP